MEYTPWAKISFTRSPEICPSVVCYHMRVSRGPFAYRSVRVRSRRSRSLARISRKYSVPVHTLRVLNRISGSSAPYNRRYVIVPRYRRAGSKSRAYSRLARQVKSFGWANPSSKRATWRPKCYLLKKGDSLYRLGHKFKMSARRIKQYNKRLRKFERGTWIKLHKGVYCPKSKKSKRVRVSSLKPRSKKSRRKTSKRRRSDQAFFRRYAD